MRHTNRRALGLLSAVLLLFLSISWVWVERSSDAKRPNIILIVTDDQNAQTVTFMPNLQRLLVEGGTSFSHAFAPTPLCCPGRASILRGQYAHNHGVKSNDGVTGGFPKFFSTGNEASTLATWLQGAGYRTALVGKYFNAYPHGLVPPEGYRSPGEQHVPPGWDDWYGLLDVPKDPRTNPYDMYGYPMNHNGRIVRYGDDPDDYLTDVLSGLAVDFVDDAVQADDPFFLYFAPTAPHLPAIPAPRHRGAFDGLEVPRSPSLNESDMSDKPRWLQDKPELAARTVRRLDRTYRRQAEMLLSLDEAIAALVQTLRERGELASTYIVFTSDHGLHYGEHRLLRTKLTPYTASARVPLVVRGPGVPKDRTVDALTLLSDVAPTVADVAEVPTPAFVDGRSLSPWLRQNVSGAKARNQVLLEFWPREGFLTDEREEPEHIEISVPEYRALRSERYLYAEYRYANGTEEMELYDLARDPFELHNIAGTVDAPLLRSLSKKLDTLQRCRAASCRNAENSALVGG